MIVYITYHLLREPETAVDEARCSLLYGLPLTVPFSTAMDFTPFFIVKFDGKSSTQKQRCVNQRPFWTQPVRRAAPFRMKKNVS